jgi:hypothetical protein
MWRETLSSIVFLFLSPGSKDVILVFRLVSLMAVVKRDCPARLNILKFKILILPFNSMSKLQAALRKNSSNEQILWKTACTDKPLFKSNSFFIAHFDFM